MDESGERLLAEEEGTGWRKNKVHSSGSWKSLAGVLLQMSTLVIFFLSGTLFGFHWRGDMDALCGAHVSQYCTSSSNLMSLN